MDQREGFIAVQGCRMCGRCDDVCPYSALYRVNGMAMVDHERCELCMKCIGSCPNKALFHME